MNKPCYDACRKISPEIVNTIIETKWGSLMSSMFDSTGFDVHGFAGAARLFKDSQPDIGALKELINNSVTRQGRFCHLNNLLYFVIHILDDLIVYFKLRLS